MNLDWIIFLLLSLAGIGAFYLGMKWGRSPLPQLRAMSIDQKSETFPTRARSPYDFSLHMLVIFLFVTCCLGAELLSWFPSGENSGYSYRIAPSRYHGYRGSFSSGRSTTIRGGSHPHK